MFVTVSVFVSVSLPVFQRSKYFLFPVILQQDENISLWSKKRGESEKRNVRNRSFHRLFCLSVCVSLHSCKSLKNPTPSALTLAYPATTEGLTNSGTMDEMGSGSLFRRRRCWLPFCSRSSVIAISNNCTPCSFSEIIDSLSFTHTVRRIGSKSTVYYMPCTQQLNSNSARDRDTRVTLG